MEYTVPNSWKEVTLRQYIDLVNIPEDLTPSERLFETLSILTGMSPSRAAKLPLQEMWSLQKSLEWCLKPPAGSFRKTFEHNGKLWGFHPRLDSLTLGEFLDLDSYCQNFPNDFHKIFGVLYRPITFQEGDYYELEEYSSPKAKARSEELLDVLTAEDAAAASVFFSLIVSGFLTISPAFL